MNGISYCTMTFALATAASGVFFSLSLTERFASEQNGFATDPTGLIFGVPLIEWVGSFTPRLHDSCLSSFGFLPCCFVLFCGGFFSYFYSLNKRNSIPTALGGEEKGYQKGRKGKGNHLEIGIRTHGKTTLWKGHNEV
ncbi:hypothetical protein LZ30DRAFT_279989 [Colletotrichum cereale]|nr:hypothetical protein LZ30DRAFT_279989 [Colletotrichum cereale]